MLVDISAEIANKQQLNFIFTVNGMNSGCLITLF